MVPRDAALNSANSSIKKIERDEQVITVIFSPDGRPVYTIRRLDQPPRLTIVVADEEEADEVKIIEIE